MKENVVKTIVAVAAGNEVTNDGVVTALSLEQSVLFGMTFGAWFKWGLAIALVLLLIERAINVWNGTLTALKRKRELYEDNSDK